MQLLNPNISGAVEYQSRWSGRRRRVFLHLQIATPAEPAAAVAAAARAASAEPAGADAAAAVAAAARAARTVAAAAVAALPLRIGRRSAAVQ